MLCPLNQSSSPSSRSSRLGSEGSRSDWSAERRAAIVTMQAQFQQQLKLSQDMSARLGVLANQAVILQSALVSALGNLDSSRSRHQDRSKDQAAGPPLPTCQLGSTITEPADAVSCPELDTVSATPAAWPAVPPPPSPPHADPKDAQRSPNTHVPLSLTRLTPSASQAARLMPPPPPPRPCDPVAAAAATSGISGVGAVSGTSSSSGSPQRPASAHPPHNGAILPPLPRLPSWSPTQAAPVAPGRGLGASQPAKRTWSEVSPSLGVTEEGNTEASNVLVRSSSSMMAAAAAAAFPTFGAGGVGSMAGAADGPAGIEIKDGPALKRARIADDPSADAAGRAAVGVRPQSPAADVAVASAAAAGAARRTSPECAAQGRDAKPQPAGSGGASKRGGHKDRPPKTCAVKARPSAQQQQIPLQMLLQQRLQLAQLQQLILARNSDYAASPQPGSGVARGPAPAVPTALHRPLDFCPSYFSNPLVLQTLQQQQQQAQVLALAPAPGAGGSLGPLPPPPQPLPLLQQQQPQQQAQAPFRSNFPNGALMHCADPCPPGTVGPQQPPLQMPPPSTGPIFSAAAVTAANSRGLVGPGIADSSPLSMPALPGPGSTLASSVSLDASALAPALSQPLSLQDMGRRARLASPFLSSGPKLPSASDLLRRATPSPGAGTDGFATAPTTGSLPGFPAWLQAQPLGSLGPQASWMEPSALPSAPAGSEPGCWTPGGETTLPYSMSEPYPPAAAAAAAGSPDASLGCCAVSQLAPCCAMSGMEAAAATGQGVPWLGAA